jgi:hypothetical protein
MLLLIEPHDAEGLTFLPRARALVSFQPEEILSRSLQQFHLNLPDCVIDLWDDNAKRRVHVSMLHSPGWMSFPPKLFGGAEGRACRAERGLLCSLLVTLRPSRKNQTSLSTREISRRDPRSFAKELLAGCFVVTGSQRVVGPSSSRRTLFEHSLVYDSSFAYPLLDYPVP